VNKSFEIVSPVRRNRKNPLTAATTAVALTIAVCTVLVAVALAGCADAPAETKVTERLAATVREKAAPNAYEVHLEWGNGPSERFVVYRRDIKRGETTSVVIAGAAEKYIDDSVKPGCRYEYTVSRFDGEAASLIGVRTVEIPTDFEISGNQSIEGMPRVINRLFLKRGAVLRTGQVGGVFEVRELIADDATLQTFPETQEARFPDVGSDAGAVTLRVRRATGKLRLANRGQTGARGVSGKDGAVGLAGAKGRPADFDANPKVHINPFGPAPHPSIKQNALNLLKIYKDDSELRRKQNGVPWFLCTVQPGDGTRGDQGAAGTDGGNGTPGGASARVLIIVAEPTDFQVDVSNDGGRGGAAGPGGAGGPGGGGGAPGDLDPVLLCTAAKAGEVGPVGPRGRDGEVGKTGFRNPVCLKLGTRESEGCAFFPATEMRQ